jgi:hypothetical protein
MKSGANRYRREGVAGVVNQVGEERHRAREDEDHCLHGRGCTEDAQADEYCLDPGA